MYEVAVKWGACLSVAYNQNDQVPIVVLCASGGKHAWVTW